jgi:small subunit ribosomal protein S5e
MSEVKLFGKWDLDPEIKDQSIHDYIASGTKSFLPHTAKRYQKKKFRKAKCPLAERLACSLMRHGRNSGKKLMAVRIVKHTLEIIHLMTDREPIQVLVEAVTLAGPREDSTRVGGQGVVRRQAVDVSPFRRINQALYLITTGARESSFRNIKTMAECLADEIINASKGSSNSYAIKKKDEIERVAKQNR